MAGERDKLKGKVKEATGVLIGDKALEREGKVDQATGAVKGAIEKVVNKVRNAVVPKGKPKR
jgi:uncharacterized protein YjbJ (UPF0337 family)